MTTVVPSISTQGWLTTIGEKTDRLLGYFFANEYAQSVSYYGKIASLQYLVAIYKSKPTELKEAIYSTLNKLLSVYFESVDLQIKVEPDDKSEVKYTIYMSARIIDKDKSYEVRHVINVTNSVISKVAKIANG